MSPRFLLKLCLLTILLTSSPILSTADDVTKEFPSFQVGKKKSREAQTKARELYTDARAALFAGKDQEAICGFEEAIRIQPHFPWAYCNLGWALMNVGEYQKALVATKKAIELKPDLAWAHHNLGCIYSDIHQWDLAIKSLRKAIFLYPNHPKSYCILGFALANTGHTKEALDLCFQQILMTPTLPLPYKKLGDALCVMGLPVLLIVFSSETQKGSTTNFEQGLHEPLSVGGSPRRHFRSDALAGDAPAKAL